MVNWGLPPRLEDQLPQSGIGNILVILSEGQNHNLIASAADVVSLLKTHPYTYIINLIN